MLNCIKQKHTNTMYIQHKWKKTLHFNSIIISCTCIWTYSTTLLEIGHCVVALLNSSSPSVVSPSWAIPISFQWRWCSTKAESLWIKSSGRSSGYKRIKVYQVSPWCLEAVMNSDSLLIWPTDIDNDTAGNHRSLVHNIA